jgi:hypothetical protein
MRAIAIAAFLWLVASSAAAQTAGDSAVISTPDRYVIDAAKLVREGGARSFADLLISQVPGLLVVPGSGLNGGGSRIRFAGVRSLFNDAPLILVDGIRVDAEEDASPLALGGPGPFRLEDLSVEDITSIEVIRGPASGAVYGPGASNGVILIHSRGARSGPLQWGTFAQGALESVPSRWPANYGGVDPYNANPDYQRGACNLTEQALGHCVQDHVQSFNPLVERSPFATVFRRQAGFTGSGGPSWGAFRLSGTFDGDDGPFAVSGVPRDLDRYSRWSLRGNATVHPLPELELGVSIGRMASDVRLPGYGPIHAALRGSSDRTAFPAWDSLVGAPGTQAIDRTVAVTNVRATPFPWLTIRGTLGLDDVRQGDGVIQPGFYRFDGRRRVRNATEALSASFRGPPGRGLRWGLTVGLENLSRRLEDSMVQGRDTTPFCAPGTACGSSWLNLRRRSLGTYVTADVVLRDRLTFTGALRHDRDKTYRFSDTRPSVGVSWIARSGAPGFLNDLRVHGAYGSTASPLPELLTFYVGPPVDVPPVHADYTGSFEFGGDAALFGGKGTASLTFYAEHSDVAKLGLIPTPFGDITAYVAGTRISNRGVAVTIAGRVIDRPDLGWDLRLSMWGNRNRLVASSQAPFFRGYQFFAPGYPTGGYRAQAIRSWADANGDGVITPQEVVGDTLIAWAGSPYPTQGAALTSGWRVGNRWRVWATLEYRAGQTLFNEVEWARCLLATCRGRNDPRSSLEEQAIASSAQLSPTVPYFEDADFLKVRALSVSFDVPAGTTSALGARAGTITLIGRNLFTWTGYSGPDPEAGSYPVPLSSGDAPSIADTGTVPPLRSWTLRVQLAY